MEIDPVVLQLRADVNKYLSDLSIATTRVDQMLGLQEKSAKHLEAQMLRSSGAIGNALKGIGASLITGASVGAIINLADGYTKFTNQLRVAGLEGEKLSKTQEDLFQIAQRYGTQLESVGTLYGRLSGNTKDLGLSQAQLLQFVEGTSAALKVSGQSAGDASGALLQLSQALGGSKIQAEEYNSLIDGARPLLQAVANGSDRFAGSVSKLTAAVKDGKVSTQDFVQAALKGMPALMAQSEKAGTTLSAAFTTLNNALGKYVGQTDQALSATARISAGIELLSRNLDTVIPALAIVGTLIGVRYVGGLVAATGATIAKTAADVRAALAIEAVAVATANANALMLQTGPIAARAAAGVSSLAVATGVAARGATLAGGALLSAFGGPVGIAILAIGAGLYYLTTQSEEATGALRAQENATLRTAKASEVASSAIDQLAKASERERAALIASMKASRARAAQALQTARAQITEAKAALAVARANAQQEVLAATRTSRGAGGGTDPGMIAVNRAENRLGPAEEKLKRAEKLYAEGLGALEGLDKAIASAGAPVAVPGATDDDKKKKKKDTSKGASGPSAADIERRFNDELVGLASQTLAARSSMARSAEEAAEYAGRDVELARIRMRDAITSNEDYSKAQKQRLLQSLEVLAEEQRNAIDFEKNRRLEQEAQQLADERFTAERDALQAQLAMADTQDERKRLALDILAAEQRHLRSVLEAVVASNTAVDADKQRARVALEALNAGAGRERAATARQNETDMERYTRGLDKTPGQINEAIDGIKIDGLDALNDGLVDALTGVQSLGETFSNVAKQIVADLLRIAIQQTIVKSLASGLGSLFGGGAVPGGSPTFNAAFAGIGAPGRASGGKVNAGTMYRINEGASPGRVEGFVPQGAGHIVPLGRMNAPTGGSTTVVQQFHLDVRGAVMTADLVAQMNGIGARAAAGAMAASPVIAERNMSSRARRRIPG